MSTPEAKSYGELRRAGVLPSEVGAKTVPFLQKIGGDEIKLEQIILQNIQAIQMTGWSMTDSFDTLRADSMFVALVKNFDTLITGFLRSVENTNTRRFFERRSVVIKEWADKSKAAPNETREKEARKLYELIIETIAKEGLFNVRRYSSFGIGFKKGQEAEVKKEIEVMTGETGDENVGT